MEPTPAQKRFGESWFCSDWQTEKLQKPLAVVCLDCWHFRPFLIGAGIVGLWWAAMAVCTQAGTNFQDLVSLGGLGPVPCHFGAVTHQTANFVRRAAASSTHRHAA